MLNKSWLDNITLKQILIIAFIPRIIAALFSQGYAMDDDHYEVIEVAVAWMQGIDISNWFNSSYEEITSGRAILYPGLHYILFSTLEFLGIERLATQMFFVRIIHAFYSLLPVLFIYKTINLFYQKKYVVIASLIWALLWFVPYMSVRNLVEMAAIPPLIAGTYFSLKAIKHEQSAKRHLSVGLLFGLAFSIRYQAALYPVGFCLGLLALRHYKEFLYSLSAGVFWVCLFHGIGDYLMSGVPFGVVRYYVEYNLNFGSSYIQHPWYQYGIVLAGFMVAPVSVFWLIGSVRFKKEMLPVFIGALTFIVIHSIFKGKQERFIFTIMPFVLILGVPGWYSLVEKGKSWLKGLTKYSFYFAGSLNIIALCILSIWFSKSSRVRMMDYFNDKDFGKNELVLISYVGKNKKTHIPKAYSGKFPTITHIKSDSIKYEELNSEIVGGNFLIIERLPSEPMDSIQTVLLKNGIRVQYDQTFHNSFVDGVHFKMNPRFVDNYEYDVYRIND